MSFEDIFRRRELSRLLGRIESDGASADIPAEWDPVCGWLLGVRDEDITVTGWVPLPA